MSVMKVIGYALLALFLTVILREVGFRGARLISLIGVVGLLSASVVGIEALGDVFVRIGQGLPDGYAVTVMKIMGVGYSSGICADACLEFGEAGLSQAITLFGRVEMLVISAPFAVAVLERGLELIA